MDEVIQSYEIQSAVRNDVTGATVLHYWAGNNMVENIKIAKKEGGVNLIVNDFYGNSLLHYAVSTSSYETVEFLLEIYRDSAEKFVNFHGITPAHIAAAKGDHRMLMLLSQSRNLLRALTPHNWGALHFAAYFGRVETVRFLLQEVPNQVNMIAMFNETDNEFELEGVYKYISPLDLARLHKHKATEQLLMSKMALPSLHASVYSKNKQAIHYLVMNRLQLNINIDERSCFRQFTPLHFAASIGDFSSCLFLYKSGCSINALDSGNMCPLELAVTSQSIPTIELLNVLSNPSQRTLAVDLAAALENEEAANVILNREFNSNILAENGDSILVRLVKSNMLVSSWRASNKMETNYDKPDKNGATALHYAAATEYEPLIETLSQIVNTDIFDNFQRSPLTYAALAKKMSSFNLLKTFTSEEVPDIFGLTPSVYSYILGCQTNLPGIDLDTERFNVDLKGFVNNQIDKTIIVSYPDMAHLTNITKKVTFKGLNFEFEEELKRMDSIHSYISEFGDKINNASMAHLMVIFNCRSGHINKLLEEHPSLVNSRDGNGMTPIMLAAKISKIGINIAIVHHRPDLTIQDNNGMTFFHYISSHDILGIKQPLTNKEIIIMQTCEAKDGRIPIHCAAASTDGKLLTQMIKQFPDLSTEFLMKKDKAGLTPIDYAYRAKNYEAVESLISAGSKNTLIEAVNQNDINLVKFLIENGAPVNSHDKNAMTPLHYSVMNGFNDIAKYLIDVGADNSIMAPNGFSPLHYAAKNNDIEMCKMLQLNKNVLMKLTPENQPYKLATNPELSNLLFKWWKRSIYLSKIKRFFQSTNGHHKSCLNAMQYLQDLSENSGKIRIKSTLEPFLNVFHFLSDVILKMLKNEKQIDNKRSLYSTFSPMTTAPILLYAQSLFTIMPHIFSMSSKTKKYNYLHGEVFPIILFPLRWFRIILHFIHEISNYQLDFIDSSSDFEKVIKKLDDINSSLIQIESKPLGDVNKYIKNLHKINFTPPFDISHSTNIFTLASFEYIEYKPSIFNDRDFLYQLENIFGSTSMLSRNIPFRKNVNVWVSIIDGQLLIYHVRRARYYFTCPLSLINSRVSSNNSALTLNTPVGSFVLSLTTGNHLTAKLFIDELLFWKNKHSYIGYSHMAPQGKSLYTCFVAFYSGLQKYVELKNMIIYSADRASCYDICLEQVRETLSVSPQMLYVFANPLTSEDNDDFVFID